MEIYYQYKSTVPVNKALQIFLRHANITQKYTVFGKETLLWIKLEYKYSFFFFSYWKHNSETVVFSILFSQTNVASGRRLSLTH